MVTNFTYINADPFGMIYLLIMNDTNSTRYVEKTSVFKDLVLMQFVSYGNNQCLLLPLIIFVALFILILSVFLHNSLKS